VAQGIGQALSEEIAYQDGRVMNANLTDYKMPTAMDVPTSRALSSNAALMPVRMARRAWANRPAFSLRPPSVMPLRRRRLLAEIAADNRRKALRSVTG
jgi:xanthine dehydrogenase molybdopterin-binding subunit B